MNDLSQPIAPATGELWQDFDGSPWPSRFPPVRVLEVKDGWVRFESIQPEPGNDFRLTLASFERTYRRVPT